MKKEIQLNKELWNEVTNIHLKGSDVYPIEEFKKGKITLNPVEIEEVGDVTGKSLLHLQCHFGLDTLSWAKLGAKVTGVDFSEESIKAANKLSKELGIPANFIISDVLELNEKLKKKFDIVFASYGVLYWIYNVDKWFQLASSFLKKGGFLYLIDGHPFYNWLNRDGSEKSIFEYKYSYFDREVQKYDVWQDYADENSTIEKSEFGWQYTVSDLINGCIKNGLNIAHFNEFASFKIKKNGNGWESIGKESHIPIMFSLKAIK